MKRYTEIVLLAFMMFFLQAKLIIAKEPTPSPNFELQDVYQDIINLNSYKNKQPVVLLFWTTWNPMCVSELTVLNNMYAGLTEEGVEVLSIDSGELPDKVSDFIKSYNLAYRVLLDKDNSATRAFQITGFPTYVLIDKGGNIVFKDNYFPYGGYKDLISK